MSACLRCIKLGLGGRLASNGGSRLIIGVSETRTCVRNAAVPSPCVVQNFFEAKRSHIVLQSNITDHQAFPESLPYSEYITPPEGFEVANRLQGKQVESLEDNAMNTLKVPRNTLGHLHCFDELGLILCLLVDNSEDIQVADAEVTFMSGSNSSVHTFHLPIKALWYPNGTHLAESDLICLVSYSQIEHRGFDNLIQPANDKVEMDVLHTQTANETSLLNSYDINLFMKDVCQEDGGNVHCSLPDSGPPKLDKIDPTGKPSMEQLSHVHKVLAEKLPKIFTQPLDFSIYHPQIVFENRIKGKVTVGLVSYIRQVALLKAVGHLKFTSIKFEILKITKHPEDGTVRVRWQIRGSYWMKALIQFWKNNLWNVKAASEHMVSWYDGYSTFFVDGDGLVYKHVADSMMPDEEQTVVEKGPLAVKVAALLGLVHRPNLGDASNSLPFDLGSLCVTQKGKDMYSQLRIR